MKNVSKKIVTGVITLVMVASSFPALTSYADTISFNDSNYCISYAATTTGTSVSRDDGTWLFPLASKWYSEISDWAGCNNKITTKCAVCGGKHPGSWADSYHTSAQGHCGLDIYCPKDTPVLATAPGKVVFAGGQKYRGNTVIVEHKIGNGWSYYSVYMHLSSCNVKAGTNVSAGQVIAKSGNTTNDPKIHYGYHLHFEILMGKSGKVTSGNMGYIGTMEGKNWIMSPGYKEGKILVNPSKNNPAGYPKKDNFGGSVLPGLKAHYGSVHYTFKKSDVKIAPMSDISYSNVANPDKLSEGSSYTIKGSVKSTYKMKELTVGVYDSKHKLVTGKKINPNSCSYDLNKISSNILFQKVPEGTYTYEITAKDINGITKTWKKTLTVTSSLKRTSSSWSALSIGGKIICSKTTIQKVSVCIYDSKGKPVKNASASKDNIKASSYNVSELDSKIMINKLPKGTYTYKVSASTTLSKKDHVMYTKTFTIK